MYEEIRDSHLDAEESVHDSSWSESEGTSPNPSDVINYYIQPVNEYENTVLTLYENYMESQGYQDPVSAEGMCKEKEHKTTENSSDDEAEYDQNTDDDGYEIPLETLTYDILSNSPVELFLFVDKLEP